MQPGQLADAAALLECAPPDAIALAQPAPRPAALLNFLGLLGPAGEILPAPGDRAKFGRLLRFAAQLDAVFPMRVPTATGAAFFGARRVHCGGGALAGSGKARQTDYAGLAGSLKQAFCACVGEAAEHDAMFVRRRDSRLSADGTLPLLDEGLRAAGSIEADRILREAGDSLLPAPRSSTGYAAGPTLAEAAMSALLECIERHAVSLWFDRQRKPAPLTPANETAREIMLLRGADATHCRLLRLPHGIACVPVAAAFSVSAQGRCAVGYGCALSAEQAALKAVRELCQGEFALHLEAQSGDPDSLAFTRRSEMFAQNADLFETSAHDIAPDLWHSDLPGLCSAIDRRVRFVNLTVSEASVPVVCALADGFRDIASEIAPGQTGPL